MSTKAKKEKKLRIDTFVKQAAGKILEGLAESGGKGVRIALYDILMEYRATYMNKK